MEFGAKELLLGTGGAFVLGMLVAYRRKATVPFKVPLKARKQPGVCVDSKVASVQ